MIDDVYHDAMGLPLPEPADCQDELLSDDALALIEHIGEVLAEEYIQLMKESEGASASTGEENDEGSNLR